MACETWAHRNSSNAMVMVAATVTATGHNWINNIDRFIKCLNYRMTYGWNAGYRFLLNSTKANTYWLIYGKLNRQWSIANRNHDQFRYIIFFVDALAFFVFQQSIVVLLVFFLQLSSNYLERSGFYCFLIHTLGESDDGSGGNCIQNQFSQWLWRFRCCLCFPLSRSSP